MTTVAIKAECSGVLRSIDPFRKLISGFPSPTPALGMDIEINIPAVLSSSFAGDKLILPGLGGPIRLQVSGDRSLPYSTETG